MGIWCEDVFGSEQVTTVTSPTQNIEYRNTTEYGSHPVSILAIPRFFAALHGSKQAITILFAGFSPVFEPGSSVSPETSPGWTVGTPSGAERSEAPGCRDTAGWPNGPGQLSPAEEVACDLDRPRDRLSG